MACTKGILLTILIGIFQPAVVFGATPGDWTAFGGVPFGCNGPIEAVEVGTSGQVYVGGLFSTCGETQVNNIAVFDPTTGTFNSLGDGNSNGTDGNVSEIEISGTTVYAAGGFRFAGGVFANRVARWDGTAWHALGAGIGGPVRAMVLDGADLYVGGNWTSAGDTNARNVARWDGAEWNTVGLEAENGVEGIVEAIEVFNGNVFVGGRFLTQAGSQEVSGIARWDGAQWTEVGAGENAGVFSEFSETIVQALAEHNGRLIVGGIFDSAGGTEAFAIAAWNGSEWSALGEGFTAGGVISLESTLSGLIAADTGGSFDGQDPDGNPARVFVNIWDGNSWTPLNQNGDFLNNRVAALGSDCIFRPIVNTHSGRT